MAPHLEPRRTMISAGLFPSEKIKKLGAKRPFIQQVDAVFPSNPALEDAFRQLETYYYTSRARLAELTDAAHALMQELGNEGDFHALSTSKHIPDVWSFEGGSFNLNVGKRTHEALGIPGMKASGKHGRFKKFEEQYVASTRLVSPGEDKKNIARVRERLSRWDQTREEAGHPEWEFAFYTSHLEKATGALSPSAPNATKHSVKPSVRKFDNVAVPMPTLSPHPKSAVHARKRRKIATDAAAGVEVSEVEAEIDDQVEDWNEDMGELFEWTGMAMLGAQRLQVNDRVDPYIAVYSPPEPFAVGEITHVCWQGFLNPQFVQAIIDTATAALSILPEASRDTFVALAAHGISHSLGSCGGAQGVPRGQGEGEATTSIVFVAEDGLGDVDHAEVEGVAMEVTADNTGSLTGAAQGQLHPPAKREAVKALGRYAMVESVGQGDARFG
ncbi:hypothetical protein DENSPDRAFT_835949 [Dentipellis sp. KUC8613]|nr:hypothetical protein DENSPDRAFT_835949 [Dentipellis sp. KUC8613]